jgi:hypothetical protein
MIKKLFVTCFTLMSLMAYTQSAEEAVMSFFNAMNNSDTASLVPLLQHDLSLHSLMKSKRGLYEVFAESKDGFLKAIGSSVKGDLNEVIYNVKSLQHDHIASVSMDYNFYYKNKFSHCGVNIFSLMHTSDGWKITSISDTRNVAECEETVKAKTNKFLDDWHMAATKADSAAYFGMIADDGVFVGTDSTEVWGKSAFAKFAGPYFAKGKAWDFKKSSRNIRVDNARSMVWFDEMLHTWMGPCRGSGWIDITNGLYKLKHYVLSVTVPNDDIQEFLKIEKNKK